MHDRFDPINFSFGKNLQRSTVAFSISHLWAWTPTCPLQPATPTFHLPPTFHLSPPDLGCAEVLSDVVESWLPARACVAKAMAAREEVHSSGQAHLQSKAVAFGREASFNLSTGEVLRLDSGKIPWRSAQHVSCNDAASRGRACRRSTAGL